MATMMISKFNQLIRSRLLWGIFLVVIVLAFVVWGMPSCIDMGRESTANLTQGTLDGEAVSAAEFTRARLGAYIEILVQEPGLAGQSAFEGVLRQLTWERLAQLRQAEKWGLTASREEVQQAIASSFADQQGQFSMDYYQGFYQQRLMGHGITLGQFEAYFGEMIVLNKLRAVVSQQAVVTPLEVRQAFHTLADTFDADYATVESAKVGASLEVGEEAVRAAYDENPESYMLPEKRVARYVTFAPEAFAEEVPSFAEEELEAFYNDNLEQFVTTVTNEDGTTSKSTREYEEAKDDVLAAMRKEAMLERAENAANEFATRAMPRRDGTVPEFAEVAAEAGLTVETTPAFALGDSPVPAAGGAFVAEAFGRDLGAFDAVSDPVAGEDGLFYVLHLDAIQAPRVPGFEEVQAEAAARAREEALATALRQQADAARAAIAEAMAAGKSFSDAAAEQGLTVVSPAPFTGLEANTPAMGENGESEARDPALPALALAFSTLNGGELSEPVRVPAGLAIAYLAGRTPASEADFEAQKGSIISLIRQRRAQECYSAFLEGLLSEERFKDLHPVEATAGEELTDEEIDAAAAAEEAEEAEGEEAEAEEEAE